MHAAGYGRPSPSLEQGGPGGFVFYKSLRNFGPQQVAQNRNKRKGGSRGGPSATLRAVQRAPGLQVKPFRASCGSSFGFRHGSHMINFTIFFWGLGRCSAPVPFRSGVRPLGKIRGAWVPFARRETARRRRRLQHLLWSCCGLSRHRAAGEAARQLPGSDGCPFGLSELGSVRCSRKTGENNINKKSRVSEMALGVPSRR